jgi:hypothetical protein
MSFDQIRRQYVMPTIVPVLAIVAAAVIIIIIGEALLAVHEPGRDELRRPELWIATAFSLVILAVAGFLATRPAGSLGKLDEPLAVGSRPIMDPGLPPVDTLARRGELGSISDIGPGYVLYARNGALARVIESLPKVEEAHGAQRHLLYAQGVSGAEDELWIPAAAVSTVYPETRSAFLAISGDETVALGWNRPPASFSRHPQREEPKLY